MKQEDFKHHLKRATEIYEQTKSSRKSAEILSEEIGENVTSQNIVRAGISSQTQNWKDEINTQENKFEVENEDIVFYHKKKNNLGDTITQRIAIPIDTVKEICKSYSKHGYRKSGTQIEEEFNLTTTAWSLIKSRIGIRKDSDVIPQNILEIIEERRGKEAVEQEIEDASYNAVVNKYKTKWVEKYWKNKEKLDDKIRETYAVEEAYLERIESYIKDGYKPKYFDFEIKKDTKSGEVVLMFTDLHLGKEGTKEVEERLKMLASDIVDMQEGKITIVYGGDTFETLVQGGMHPGQTRKLEIQGLEETVMYAVDLFEDFLVTIGRTKEIEMYALRGNHDRYTKNNDDDLVRMGAFTFMMIVDERVKNYGFKIHNLGIGWHKFDAMGFRFVIAHGDFRHSSILKKRPIEIFWEYGNQNMHNIMLAGHEHHFEGMDVAKNATTILCPGLAGAGEYDTQLVKSSYCGYTLIENKRGYPKDSITRLP